ncbi:MAG: ABC transporter ATP-binding protein [Pseudanabaenaceae cyanobacterium]
MAELRLDRISKRWGDRTVLAELSLEIPDGEFWVLVGPSGCGKSTILRLIAGLDSPTTGEIWLGQQLMNPVPARQRDVAMVFQNYALYPHMTVAENLAFGLKMRGLDARTIQERTLAIAKTLQIEHLLQRKPSQLSGGQQQRVALGRAIIRAPQVFLLDEPLSNLDAQLRDSTRSELKLLHQHIGITTVYVTHDQTEAMTLADKIVVLDQGKIQQIGTPLEVYTQPSNLMVAGFFGNPPMNLLPAHCHQGALFFGAQYITCPHTATGWQLPEKLILGIRSEEIQYSLTKVHASLQAIVLLLEPLGSNTIVRVCLADLPTATLQLNLPSSIASQLRPEDSLWLTFPPTAIYLFDPDTGDRLV